MQSIAQNDFTLLDQEGLQMRLHSFQQLGAMESAAIRETLYYQVRNAHQKVYVDARGIQTADLSGINELIQAQHSLQRYNKSLVVVFEEGSQIDKWFSRLGLDKFIETAIFPA